MNEIQSVKSYAKMNLFLHIVGRRNDGYHLLESLFVRIRLHDTIEFKARSDSQITLHSNVDYIQDIEQDLMVRAGRKLQALCQNKDFGVDIYIQKSIPTGAGLGGGSSNCAMTLLTLNKLWDLNLPLEKLSIIALELGADVPFFLYQNSMAFIQGIGEIIQPIDSQELDFKHKYVLLIKPNVHISTGKIFTHSDLKRNSESVDYQLFFKNWDSTHNDLQPLAELLYPEVKADLALLKQLPNAECVRMTGSGACVFALFNSQKALNQAFQLLPFEIQQRSFLTDIF